MYAIIRVRGTVNIKPGIKKAMHLIRLNRVNHCILVNDDPTTTGNLQKIKDYVTWGEVDNETLSAMLEKRGRIIGNKPIDVSALVDLGYSSYEDLAEAIIKGDLGLKDPLKPVFRLHPPASGYEGIKKPFKMGGALGYRGQKINDLIRRML